MKTSYTYINKLRADLTFYLVTASFCNYTYSVRVAAFFTSRADVQTVCCGTTQLESVQTTYHSSFLLPLQVCPSKGTSMRIFKPDSLSACHILNFVCSEAFHYVLLKAKSFPHCLRQHSLPFATGVAECPVLTAQSVPSHGPGNTRSQTDRDKTPVLSGVVTM